MVVIFSIISTLVMTAFSYICGYVSGNQFREPELLNQLVATSSIPVNPHKKGLTGWFIHLVLGFFFGLILKLVYNYLDWNNLFLFIISFGAAAGILGILGWHIMFNLNPNPPDTDLKNFYLQLIVAHIVFTAIFIILLNSV